MSELKDGWCKFCGKTYKRFSVCQSKSCCPNCSTKSKFKAVYTDAKPKNKIEETNFKADKTPYVNTGDDYFKEHIGKTVKI